jgi:hypothetical protein
MPVFSRNREEREGWKRERKGEEMTFLAEKWWRSALDRSFFLGLFY